jgi:hypothetical protein
MTDDNFHPAPYVIICSTLTALLMAMPWLVAWGWG